MAKGQKTIIKCLESIINKTKTEGAIVLNCFLFCNGLLLAVLKGILLDLHITAAFIMYSQEDFYVGISKIVSIIN